MQRALVDKLAASVLGLVFPSVCPLCENPSDSHRTAPICRSCWQGIEKYTGPSCGICSLPLGSEEAAACGGCLKNPPPFRAALSFGLYEGALREAIHQLKFDRVRRLARPLGGLLSSLTLPDADAVVPVPQGPRALRERGFSHTLLLARELSRAAGVPLMPWTLVKTKDTPPQARLTRAGRLKNLRGAFGTRGRLPGLRVVVVDDVMTTGATLRECARALLSGGASEVYAVSLSRSAL